MESEKTYRQYVIEHWFEAINDELSLAEAASNGHWEGELREQLAILNDYQALEAERDELRELIRSICPPAWDDERMDYVEVQIDKDDYARMLVMKGGDDE